MLNAACVLGTQGRRRVNAIELARLGGDELTRAQTQPCDLVLMSGGYTPSVHLHSQSRGKLTWCESLQAFMPGAAAERTRSAGACRGVFDLGAVVSDGAAAGAAAAREALDPARTGGESRWRAAPRRTRRRARPAPATAGSSARCRVRRRPAGAPSSTGRTM